MLYNQCEKILALIPDVFPNYTLHDIQHSIRVIGYMNELVKDHLDQYSCLHIALMIYSGLLHDIGMFVSADEKERMYSDFSIKVPMYRDYSESEKLRYLQEYIRENHGRRVRTVLEYKMNIESKLKSLFYVGKTNSYDICPIVSSICQAHTESSEWIVENEELNCACYENDTIYPRQIAVLLRIGDYLDIDDRRAPYVLYSALNPQGSSDDEWKTHIPITNYNKIGKDGDLYTITFSGKCSEPEIYRKIEDFIGGFQDQLAKDMQLCSKEFKLNIKLPIVEKIETVGFESTPLRFNLDYKQITKLLMGEQIYGNKKAGLRELIQNAIDAVLLMKEIEEKDLYSTYSPMVGIDFKKAENHIIIVDNGIGMSEEVISQFFFNIGNSFYESNGFNREGFKYNPIGHFGIGFLACFMLSSKITLETRHYSENAKPIRMSFDKRSPYIIKYKVDRSSIIDHGTRITMDYDQVIPGVFEDEASIQNYIRKLIRNSNIRFSCFYGKKKENIELEKPNTVYRNDKEIIEWYQPEDKFKPIIYSARKLFARWSGNLVFVYDGINMVSLGIIKHFIDGLVKDREFDHQNLSKEVKVNSKIAYDKIENNLSQYPFLQSYITQRCKEIQRARSINIIDLYESCLTNLLTTDYLTYYKFTSESFVYDRNSLFDDNMEDKGSVENYKTYPKVIVLCTYDCDNDKNGLQHIFDVVAKECGAYYSYSTPKKHTIELLRHENTNQFFIIEKNKDEIAPSIYLKGIFVVRKDFILFPYQIRHIAMGNYEFGGWFNFSNRHLTTNVARNDIDKESEKEICQKIICLYYLSCINDKRYGNTEREMMDKFLRVYYTDTYKEIQKGIIQSI